MAENGRGPNDFRGRNGKRRREPPIIDASATEVPVDASTSEPPVSDPVTADADLQPAAPPEGADAAPLPAAEPHAHDHAASDAPGDAPAADAVSADSSADAPQPRETEEPVLFGSALREPPARTEGAPAAADAPAAGDAPDAAADAPPEPVYAPAYAAAAPAAPARAGGGIAPWLLTLSTLVLLGALAWVLYTEPQRGGRAEIDASLADLKSKVAALDARPDGSAAQSGVAALDKRVATADSDRVALAKSVAGLSTRLDGVAQQAQAAKAEADKASQAAGAADKAAQADANKPAPAPAPTGAAAAATVGGLAALAAKVEGVDGRVSALGADQTRTAKAVADLPKPVAPDFGPTDAKIAALGAALGGRVASVETQLTGKVAALDGRLTSLDGKVNGYDARLNDFDSKVNGVAGKINGFDARMNGFDVRANGLESKLSDATNGLGKLQSTVAGLPKVDLGPLQTATDKLGKRVDAIEGQLSASKDGARATEARAVGSADESRATPVALVGQAVQRAVADGRPYAADLDTLKALGAEPDALSKLQPLAAKGAPTAAALKARWEAVEGDVVAAVKPAETGSALDRFAANARALVSVRQVGAVQGEDPGATVSQVSAALDAGDVAGALVAWNRLPQAGKDRSTDWAAAAQARLDAASAASGLVSRAIATLGRTKS